VQNWSKQVSRLFKDVEGLERSKLMEMMAALITNENVDVMGAEATAKAETDLEITDVRNRYMLVG